MIYFWTILLIGILVLGIILGLSVAMCAIASGKTNYRIQMEEIKEMQEREIHK
jgi:hypothetical protein